ncbi:response regulator transcription factor [Cryobacterium sp. MDB2-33-2]
MVVDDQPMYRVGLTAILSAQPDMTVVADANDGVEAVRQNRTAHPDIVLMDVRMPNMNGIDATRQLISPIGTAHIPRIIMLTTFDIDDYVYAALRAGASGFLLKDTEPEQLATAVRTVAAGDALLAPSVTRRLIENFVDSRPAGLTSATVLNELTERERDVFMLVASGASNREIASKLYIAEQTAKSHVSRMMTKLQLRDRVHAVVLGYETGAIRPGKGATGI